MDMIPSVHQSAETWPSLALDAWKDTYETLHRWSQIVGKLRLTLCPFTNHWWHTTLYVTARGLTTSTMPYGTRTFQVDFDFISHQLLISTNDGDVRTLPLAPRSVADFYRELMSTLHAMGIDVRIWPMSMEIETPSRFDTDTQHRSYDPEYANRCWRIMVETDRVLKEFRSRFIGKVSPSHFFWGSFDLAVTRFSGRRAPIRQEGGLLPAWITQEAYSHEVSSTGFWPGSGAIPYPAFYSYAYPEPPGFKTASISPGSAFYAPELGEFILPYENVRTASSPDATLLAFLQTTYEAAADRGQWNRVELERQPAAYSRG
jgi:hypothetical protein